MNGDQPSGFTHRALLDFKYPQAYVRYYEAIKLLPFVGRNLPISSPGVRSNTSILVIHKMLDPSQKINLQYKSAGVLNFKHINVLVLNVSNLIQCHKLAMATVHNDCKDKRNFYLCNQVKKFKCLECSLKYLGIMFKLQERYFQSFQLTIDSIYILPWVSKIIMKWMNKTFLLLSRLYFMKLYNVSCNKFVVIMGE